MKNIFIILLVLVSISCKAQSVDINTPTGEMNNGDYAEDSNNEFGPYLGTWEATWNNKKMTLYLTKMFHVYRERFGGGYCYEDLVIGKYTVVDLSSGAVLEDTTNITNIDNMPIISSRLYRTKNFLSFLYMKRGVNAGDCKILSVINLYRDLNNPNILTYKYYVDSYNYEGCPYTNVNDIPVNIPKQEVVLHKL